MKKSIAKKAAWQVVTVLLAAMIILWAGAFFVVSKYVYSMNASSSLTVLDLYSEHLTEYSNNNNVPIDENIADIIVQCGDNICDKYGTDYIYLYTIDEETSSITYIAGSVRDVQAKKNFRNNMIGRYVECELYPDEIKVWHGEKESATITINNSLGHEVTTLKLIHDCKGNKIIAGIETSYSYIFKQIISSFVFLAVPVTLVLVCIGVAIYYFIRKRISLPAKEISRSMQEYIVDGNQSKKKLEVKGNDEFSMIAQAFNRMTDDIGSYVESIRTLSEEKANRNAEFNIASEIQRGFLSAPSFENDECSIRAMMAPAKEIGGDLYDYIQLGNGRYLVVIADVSGKGVSAALFMSMALTLIRQFARMGLMPDEIMRRTNNALAENNSRMLFVTAFIGIYDSNDYSFTYSNAGHNLPYKIGGELKILDEGSGILLGIFENETFRSERITLNPGETVFLYTDGITESVNENNCFWGIDGLEKALGSFKRSDGAAIVDYIYNEVSSFGNGVEPHDDITMLALNPKKIIRLELSYDVGEFEKIKSEILRLRIPRSQQLNLCLAAEEIFVNIISYAFDGNAPENEKIEFSLAVSDHIEIHFADSGMPFNPFENVSVPDDGDDFEIGGLGRYISVSMTDDASYQFSEGKNIVTLFRYIEEEER